jgi:hypothetical protein
VSATTAVESVAPVSAEFWFPLQDKKTTSTKVAAVLIRLFINWILGCEGNELKTITVNRKILKRVLHLEKKSHSHFPDAHLRL